MRVAFDNAADLARALAEVWRNRGRVAYPLPHNRWQWDDSTTWRVVPAPDKAAFKYAKIVVSSSPRLAEPDELFVGLYVEKGLGPALAAAGFYPDDWVMGPTWRWHGMTRDLSAGAFCAPIVDAVRRTRESIEIRVDAHVPVFRGTIRPGHDLLVYESLDGLAMSETRKPIFDSGQGFLRAAADARTLPQLGKALQTIPEGGLAWVNLYLGRALHRSGLHDASAVDAHQLADQLLEPFAQWVT